MCWPNIESGPSALTLMFHIRPSPMYVSVCVKLQSHCWVCDETKQAILIVDLADFLVGTHKSICEHVAWKHRWVIGDTILIHGCFTFFTPFRKDVATRSFPRNLLLCRMQKYMNNTRHGDIWTSVRTRQTQPNSPTEACFRACCSEGRCHFFSLRHTLRGYVYGKHECLCSMLWINVVPALIFF